MSILKNFSPLHIATMRAKYEENTIAEFSDYLFFPTACDGRTASSGHQSRVEKIH